MKFLGVVFMSQNGNTNSNFFRDYLTVAFNPDMLRLTLNALYQNPQILPLGLNMMQQCPELTAHYIQTQAHMIRGANQSTNLAQEKEVLTKQNEELKEKNAKLKTDLSNANKKIADLENKIDEMKKNTIKTHTANFAISSMQHSILTKLNELKNKDKDQSQEPKPALENSAVNQIQA